jgi:hypothetical protein
MVGAKEYFADLRASLTCATTLRRGLVTTECSYVKRPCPSAHTSYSRYSSNATFLPGCADFKPNWPGGRRTRPVASFCRS